MFAINVGVSSACNSQAFKAINAGNIKTGCRLIAYKPSGAPNWSYAGGKFHKKEWKHERINQLNPIRH